MRICFVCMGNICRSPTAEGVMKKLAADAGVAIELDSAGTGGWHAGELPDPRSRASAAKRGYELTHRARQFTADDFADFDLVIAMDRENLAILDGLRRVYHAKLAGDPTGAPPVRLLRSYEPGAPRDAEVPDPYSGGADGFEQVLDICERACRGLLEAVR